MNPATDGCQSRPTPAGRGREWKLFIPNPKRGFPPPNLALSYQPRLLCMNALERFGGRLVARVLFHELSPHGQIKNELPQTRDGVGRVADAVEMREELHGIH